MMNLNLSLILTSLTFAAIGAETQGVPKPYNDEDPYGRVYFEQIGVIAAWEKYQNVLTFGKGQTLALLDDGCDVDIPEWKVVMPWGPKVIATWNSMTDTTDCRAIPPAQHGTTMAFPSSLNYNGKAGIAYNNFMTPVSCVKMVHISESEIPAATVSMKKALEWVVENRERLNITAVNLAPVDDQAHAGDKTSDLDPVLKKLRELGVWVSAPCGNNNYTTGISWPAASPYCFAIGGADWGKGEDGVVQPVARFDRFSNTDILSPAGATSSSNAFLVGSAMVVREAIEKSGYDWKTKGKTLPDAMLAIFKETGRDAHDKATGLTFKMVNLLGALDYVFANSPKGAVVNPSPDPSK